MIIALNELIASIIAKLARAAALKPQTSKLLLLASSTLFLTGCTSTLHQSKTGFLDNYQLLVPSEQFENTKLYRAAWFDKDALRQIRKIHLVPFEVWIDAGRIEKNTDGSEHLVLQQSLMPQLSRYLYQQLAKRLSPDYQLVSQADDETLTIRGAFSDIEVKSPELGVTDFIPVRLVLNAGNNVYLSVTDQKQVISRVAIEAEFLYGKEQRTAVAMMASKEVALDVAEKDQGFAAISAVLDIWVENFVEQLAIARDTGS
ncbi:MAG: hypothetical protein CL811_03450 [Colwelliaceae bacterium]|nr:hypothetical protein [Colwelliaceae bacterium]